MFSFIETWKVRTRDWCVARAESAHARFWLFAIAFTESSFFLIPPDIILIAMLLSGARRVWYLAGITTLGSVAGGLFGYAIGALLFGAVGERVVALYHLEDEFVRVAELFADNAFWTIFVSAFTPIPYKVFTIAGGLFGVHLLTFIIASIIGRGLRFAIVTYIFSRYGARIGDILFRHFNTFSLTGVALIVVYIVFKLVF